MEFLALASVANRHRRMNAALGAMLLLAPLSAGAQGTLEDYRRAATINQRFANLTTGLVSAETWIGPTNQAVYRVTVPGGARFVRVDAEQWTKQPAFDHAAVAKSLSSVAGEQYTAIAQLALGLHGRLPGRMITIDRWGLVVDRLLEAGK